MARERNVTRTFKVMHVTVLVANSETRAIEEVVVDLPRIYKDEKALVKVLTKEVNTDIMKFVSVVDTSVEEKLMGMSEIEFLKHAKELKIKD